MNIRQQIDNMGCTLLFFTLLGMQAVITVIGWGIWELSRMLGALAFALAFSGPAWFWVYLTSGPERKRNRAIIAARRSRP